MIEQLLEGIVGGLIRMSAGAAAAAPTLLVGLLIAAVLRFYLGAEGTRKLFGGNSLRALPQSWAVGMLLPVCSIGVLPILIEMRRSRVTPGAMSAFALSAPLFNPLSLLYGLTLSRPYVILGFAFGSLIVVTLVGMIWDKQSLWRKSAESVGSESDASGALVGSRRLAAVAVYMVRQLFGPSGGWALVALSGLMLLSVALPHGTLQQSVERDDPLAPATTAAVALPAYATPMVAMSQLGMMFQHANSPGAAFALLVLATGVNIATVLWFGRSYGWKPVAKWLGSVVAVVLVIGYAINRPLIPPGVEPAGHTHAFDIYTNPIHRLETLSAHEVTKKIAANVTIGEQAALALLGVLLVVGAAVRLSGVTVSRLMQRAAAAASRDAAVAPLGGFDRAVSPRLVGATMLVGLIALSVVMCYGYYPAPEECLEEIRIARAETLSAARSGDVDHALYWLVGWDQWSRRLEVGTFLRRGTVRPYQRMQGYLIRKKLELLEHELQHDPFEAEETQAVLAEIYQTNERWVRAFRN